MHNFAKKTYYLSILAIFLGLNSYSIDAKTIKFDELLSTAWENQTNAKTFSSSKQILEISQQNANSIFKDRPTLEINSALGNEKEYQVKTSFELKNSLQKKLAPQITDAKLNTLSLEQIKHKLEFAKLLRAACFQFILSQQQLQNIIKQLKFSLELKNNSFKQYKAGLISYVSFKQIELDIIKIQKLQHDTQHELQTNLVELQNIANNININVEDNIEINVNLNIYNQKLNQNIDVENHPLYKYQQSIIQQTILQKSYAVNKSKYPITWSVGIGANAKQEDKTNYKIIFGAQIPLGKDYNSMQESAEIDKHLIEYKNQLLLLKNQLTNNFMHSIKNIQMIEEQLQILQSAIQAQTHMLEIYAKAMKAGEIDISVYIKNKQELFSLQQQDIKHKIQLQQAKINVLQELGLL